MAATIGTSSRRTYQLDLSSRGYQVLFWRDQFNRCPGCGRSNWHVGRITAECGFCSTALQIGADTQAGFELTGHKAVALHVIKGGAKPRRKHERRRAERIDARGRTIALHIDGTKYAFALSDISTGGVKGQALDGISDASQLVIELEDGTQIPAELKWCDGEFAGLAYIAKPARGWVRPEPE